jgi:hypothetical protein
LSISRFFHLTLLIVFCGFHGTAQRADSHALNEVDTSNIAIDSTDSLNAVMNLVRDDSTVSDSNLIDSIIPKKRKSTLDHEVLYNSEDSMIIDLASDKVYLYGNATAEYGDIKLEADFIEISLGTSELRATGMPDSTGEFAGFPVFTQGGIVFDSEEMRYNFKTQRGLSKSVRTQEGAAPNVSYIHGELVKKDTGKVIYIKNGKYTTCSYDEPHYHIHAGKLKIITEDKIVTGPAYLSIEDIPTPLAVPFGFFPNSEGRANGLIVPAWGEARGLGLGLTGGGYYFGVGDRADFAITADVYSRGSWNGYLNSRYAKKYKYNGSLGLQLIKRVFGDPEFPGYRNLPIRYRVLWTHRQDPKAKPGRTFSASVDFGNPDADRLNINSGTTRQTRNSTKSSINYSKTFANSPFAFRASASSDQNAGTGNVNVQLPTAALTMARIYPFKRKQVVGKEKPWEKIGVRGTLEGKNQVNAPFESLFTDSTFNEMRNGLSANIPINAGYKVFRYVTLSPSINNRLYGLRQTIRREWNADSNRVDEYKVNELNGYWTGNAAVQLSTIIYGVYNYKSDLIKAMRHQLTPTIGVSYAPDYSDPSWGYFKSVQVDSFENFDNYSIYATGIYSAPGSKENGVINMSLNNTFEVKVKDLKDSTGTGDDKKLRLLDAFNFSTSYNIAKDSNRWNPLAISVRTSIVPGLRFLGSASLNPYAWNETSGRQTAEYWFEKDGSIGRWQNARVNMAYSIRPKSSRNKSKQKEEALSENGLYYTDFVDFEVPWSASVGYNISYNRRGLSEVVNQTIDFSGDVNITQNWKFGFITSYNIRDNDFGDNTSFNIYRDLHCWEMSFNVLPFGTFQSYRFGINVKASMLQDLKLNRNRNFNVPLR